MSFFGDGPFGFQCNVLPVESVRSSLKTPRIQFANQSAFGWENVRESIEMNST
jgi:hypothetical protein